MTPDVPLSDAALWSLVDGGTPALDRHLASHPGDRERVEAMRAVLNGIRSGLGADGTPPRIAGHRIEGVLGRGGMGVVYRAEQQNLPRAVAIKVVHASFLDERGASRFRREVAALARLEHPRIAAILDTGTAADGSPWYSMRLVRGLPLVEHARAAGLDRRRRLELFVEMCEAVEFAHRAGVVHRDLKPANVLVDPASGPVVLDFGLARLREDLDRSRASETGTAVLGTLAYMAPEQARGESADERADVYALGAMLHELLVGCTPHDLAGRSLVEGARLVAETEPPRPRARLGSLDQDLETILRKALSRDPSRRYSTAISFAEDVRRFLDGRPILARGPSLSYRSRRFLARHWLGLLVSSLVVACVLLALASSLNAFRVRLFRLGGDWWREGAPFEELRWSAHRPEVLVDGRWYELLAIDDLETMYVLGFARQEAGKQWRKRFSEDLVQVLNQMGDWCMWSVDLVLRDLETGEIVAKRNVPLEHEQRQRIHRDRFAWPFRASSSYVGRWALDYRGRTWDLVSLEGHPTSELDPFLLESELDLGDFFDVFVDATGDSPPAAIDFVLEDPTTGEVQRFEDVDRDARR